MTTLPRLVAFDLDDTLAASKSPLDPRMAELMVSLLGVVEVCVISGGQIAQFHMQLIDNLDTATDSILSRLHLMPTCGTQYYRHSEGAWNQIYAEYLSDDEKSRALAAVEATARALGYWEADTWGPILEDRGSQITFSALGQGAPVVAKTAWDPSGEKKNTLREAVQLLLPDLEVRSGGSTSVDITRQGIDKAYGMLKLADLTGVPLDDMLFVGDRLDENGNDYPVKALGVECVAVEGWKDTAAFLETLIPQLTDAAARR
ncbi:MULTISPECIES: HAD-IIB family hydrolase [Cryobacterium]|uniref:HAD-IIB family hydrolase n=1 Tax=Cryobacterium breve TaxID=1259258 RepID=A0ABY2J9Z4_9MICO|nr:MULTISPECIES: HAD-IIB family hydrolase [Cryobacterium]TFC94533.1 HAD-IIB family hydrolase [Cryobacterium sp. TmT3-12]TFD00879.1 HAD-IIB family hydrolase [Cryobacterium breve]